MAAVTRSKKAKQLKHLRVKRAHIIGSIELIREFDENFDSSKTFEIPFRLERLDKLMEEFESVESELDSFCVGDPESANGLMDLADEFEKHVKILDSLETKAQHWDSVLVELLFSRMDINTQGLWENRRDKTKRPSYDDLLEYLHEHSRTLQSLKLSQSAISFTEAKTSKSRPVVNYPASEQIPKCIACKQNHYLFQCEFFRAQTPMQRLELVKRSNLCINCLKASHLSRNCSSVSCKYCQKKHHTLLHLSPVPTLIATEVPSLMQATQSSSPQQNLHSAVASVDHVVSMTPPSVHAPYPASSGTLAPLSTACQTVAPATLSESTVILYTALVKVRDNSGQFQLARALLDSGSQSSFVSESLCQRLGLRRRKVNIPVSGIGQAVVNVRYTVTVQFSSRFGPTENSLECLVLPKLTVSVPTSNVDISAWKIPQYLPLADPQFNISHGIDFIVDAEMFSVLLHAEQVRFNDQLPVLQKTSLGYVFAGKVATKTVQPPVTCLVSTFDDLDAQVKKFWEAENFEQVDPRRDVMLYGFLSDEMLPTIGETWSVAARRFTAMEKRFRADDSLRFSYVQFMEEYRQLGHMEEVQSRVALPQYFLPHHAIHRPDSSTTKIRVVFDDLAKSSNHISLNDLLLTGPTVQPTLLSIVLNFRLHRYVMTADIEKMYRQILVHPDDRSLQKILWRKGESDSIKPYQLNTVTYGTSCAPYLATRTLNQLADDDGHAYPLAASVLKQDFYVDDLLTGSDNLDTLLQTNQQLCQLLKQAGFSLRKWSANKSTVLQHIPEKDRETLEVLELDQSPSIKTLGLLWFPSEDLFGFKIPKLPVLGKVTKRIALTEVSQLFVEINLITIDLTCIP
ncbi:uncharacterized protein LOC128739943 [Sabethes cyaneus]|uniref:uncharacterized protein LOC128739943 n=1 Tax=Sabethes cyaneus TaxID=53552 RepID=UPI00237E80CB|nr:uncharacterized protein LOC128739943 [Sabethes cyaneus]